MKWQFHQVNHEFASENILDIFRDVNDLSLGYSDAEESNTGGIDALNLSRINCARKWQQDTSERSCICLHELR
jgi:hypothetical protein